MSKAKEKIENRESDCCNIELHVIEQQKASNQPSRELMNFGCFKYNITARNQLTNRKIEKQVSARGYNCKYSEYLQTGTKIITNSTILKLSICFNCIIFPVWRSDNLVW